MPRKKNKLDKSNEPNKRKNDDEQLNNLRLVSGFELQVVSMIVSCEERMFKWWIRTRVSVLCAKAVLLCLAVGLVLHMSTGTESNTGTYNVDSF